MGEVLSVRMSTNSSLTHLYRCLTV